jgi:hypothetical protein
LRCRPIDADRLERRRRGRKTERTGRAPIQVEKHLHNAIDPPSVPRFSNGKYGCGGMSKKELFIAEGDEKL